LVALALAACGRGAAGTEPGAAGVPIVLGGLEAVERALAERAGTPLLLNFWVELGV
jgi:hypothetical protein